MVASARADSSGTSLVVSMEGGWTLTLRRVDFKPDAALSRYFGEEIRAEDLKVFLPNWARLAWTRLPASAFYSAEASAQDGDYLVSIQGAGGGEKDGVSLIESFCNFMKG